MTSFAPALRPARIAPNLIMPGVAKCGTTSLYDILVRHPAITGGEVKEIRFLLDSNDDLVERDNVNADGLAGWMARYPDRGEGAYRYWLDATPAYQYQATAPRVIAGLEDKPRLIFIVRRPSRRLFSMYRYLRYQVGGYAQLASFAQFVDGIRGPLAPWVGANRMVANAMADTRYDEMLERWMALVPAGNVWVTTLEALGADQDGVVSDLCHWLGLPADPLLGLSEVRSNPTRQLGGERVLKVNSWLSDHLPEQGVLRRAKNFAYRLVAAPPPARELAENAELFARIDHEFAPHVERFNALAAAIQPGFRPLPV